MIKCTRIRQSGFTLVELLIVVIILAILAAIVVPQFGSSTEDAQASTLKADLAQMRSAIELYYHQHNSRYPGETKETDGTATATALEAEAAIAPQLTQYTDINGAVSGTKTAVFKFGPYLKQLTLPANPFMTGAAAIAVDADITVVDVTTAPTADSTTGWRFYTGTGRLVANDGQSLSDGTATVTF